MSEKKGIEFFKSFAGGGKPSILAGMRIKANKDVKPAYQTETHLSFTDKKQQPPTSSKDDSSLKKQTSQQYVPPVEPKEEEPFFKKSKPLENSSIADKKISPRSRAESKGAEEPIKPIFVQSVVEKREEEYDLKSNKSSVMSSEEGRITAETLTSTKPTKLKNEKEIPKKKTTKPEKVQTKKSDEPFSASTRKGSTSIQPKKVKKSDRQQILNELNDSTLALVNIILKQKEIKQHISQNKQAISDLRANAGRWASKQAACAEREEYEEADRLQTQIEESQKKIEQLEIELAYMEDQVANKEQEEVALLKTQNSNIKRLSRRLKLVELQLQDDAANLKREEMERIEQLRAKQENEKKKMQRLEKDINYQSEQLGEFEKDFKNEVNAKMDPLVESRNTLELQKGQIENQIKELERKLKEKKANLTEVSKELKSVVDSINETQAQFKEESDKLQERKNKLEVIENERDQMQLGISDIEASIEEETKIMDRKVDQKLREATELAQLAKGMEQKQLTFQDDMESRRVLLDSYLASAKCLKQFEEKHREQKDKIKEIQYKKSTVSAEITRLQERKEQLKKRLPGLENEQKKYADQKNFKAAGIKKGQIKQINQELVSIKERLDGCLGEEHGLELELEELVAGQKDTNEEEAQLLKNLAVSQVKFNIEKVDKLKEYKEEIQRSSRMAAKEKDRIVRELQGLINRMEGEITQLSLKYDLTQSKQEDQQEQEELQEGEQNEQQEEVESKAEQEEEKEDEKEEERPEEENNNEQREVEQKVEVEDNDDEENREYTPLVIEGEGEENHESEDNNEEGGYVPLQLD